MIRGLTSDKNTIYICVLDFLIIGTTEIVELNVMTLIMNT